MMSKVCQTMKQIAFIFAALAISACDREPSAEKGSTKEGHAVPNRAKSMDRAKSERASGSENMRKIEKGLEASNIELAMDGFHGLLNDRNELAATGLTLLREAAAKGGSDDSSPELVAVEARLHQLDIEIAEARVELRGRGYDSVIDTAVQEHMKQALDFKVMRELEDSIRR